MTDNEIIKALKKHSMDLCSNCKVEKTTLCNDCISEIERNALDLINRQQAKIERLLQKTQQPQIGTTKELKVIKLVETEYEKAKNLEYIRNPLAYALHKVWKMVDAEKGGVQE